MTKITRLAELIGMTENQIVEEIDSGMIDILLVLNEKGYKTIGCCEGHLNNNNEWNSYLGFAFSYVFETYPKNHSYSRQKRKFFYWDGVGEESRQKTLKEILEWANSLPIHEPVYEYYYSLVGVNKRSHKSKILAVSNNYEDIKCRLQQKDIVKYDVEIHETNKRLIG